MISKYLTEYMIDANIINEDDKSIIQYGIYGLISTFFNIATILVIGAYYQCIVESMLFTIVFYFLRIYAGGYHAKTSGRCYLFSVLITFFNFGIIHRLRLEFITLTLIFMAASVIIFLTSPMDSTNKPLDTIEKEVYRKKSRITIFISIILYFIFFFLKIYPVCWAISIAYANVGILLTLSAMKKQLTLHL